MEHRNYAAGVLGRFISRDPIGHAGNLNLYAYPTNPVSYVDPTGLECEIYFSDGTKPKSSSDPNEVRKFIEEANDKSIRFIRTRGHGSVWNLGFDPSDESAPGLRTVGDKIILEAGGPEDVIDFAELLRPKLDDKASIALSNCYTAVGDENIARLLSKKLPNAFIQGIDGELLELQGLLDLWVRIGPAGGKGFPKVYQSGEVIPLGDLIRTHLGIYPK